jgi:hypothetical protein
LDGAPLPAPQEVLMVAEWYYEADGKQFGPVTASELKRLAGNGFLQPTHLIWKDGVAKKAPARSVKGLFSESALASATPTKQATGTATAKPTTAKKPPPPEEKLEPLEALEELAPLEAVEELETLEAVEEIQTLEVLEEEELPEAKLMPAHPTPAQPAAARAPAWAPGHAPAVPGKPFRVMRNGKAQGPFSVDEIRRMLAAGQLGAADLIGVEMWLPVAGAGGLLLGMGGSAPADADGGNR